MCGGGPPFGTSCDSTALTTPPVSRPWMRMTIGMPRTFIFLPPSDGIWIGCINIGGDVLLSCAGWQDNNPCTYNGLLAQAAARGISLGITLPLSEKRVSDSHLGRNST